MGYKIKEAREKKNMTQDELSKQSGVSRGTISSLENGTSRATTTRTLMMLAKALGMSLDELFSCDECLID